MMSYCRQSHIYKSLYRFLHSSELFAFVMRFNSCSHVSGVTSCSFTQARDEATGEVIKFCASCLFQINTISCYAAAATVYVTEHEKPKKVSKVKPIYMDPTGRQGTVLQYVHGVRHITCRCGNTALELQHYSKGV